MYKPMYTIIINHDHISSFYSTGTNIGKLLLKFAKISNEWFQTNLDNVTIPVHCVMFLLMIMFTKMIEGMFPPL